MKKLIILTICAMLIFATGNSSAQINNILKSAKNKSLNKVNNTINKSIDKTLNPADKDAKEEGKKDDQTNHQEDKNAEPATQQEAPSLQTYSKYDFIPGEKVIFFDDFSQDNIGDFPALWNTNGSAEVVTTNLFPGRWMQFTGREAVWTDELLKLPENYTIEFDIIPIKGDDNRMAGYSVRLLQSVNAKAFDHGSVPGMAGFMFKAEYYGTPRYSTYINGDDGQGLGLSGSKDQEELKQKLDKKYHIAIWIQKSRVRFYQDQNKLFDLPKAFPVSSVKFDRLRFEDGALMVSNIRIAVGTPDTRSKLMTEGKLVTYGIYFDVNKDVVKPESYGTLKDIAAVLNENPGVKVKIIGYTDSDGDDKTNLDLSKRRAASVKDELVKSFAVEGSRLETDGMGEGQPVAPNDTPSNKALNRRVEFIKIQ